MDCKYDLIQDFFQLPNGERFGLISRVVADANDRIYVFQRRDPPVAVFERDGRYVGSWGAGEVRDPHGLKIVGDVVYTTDRADSVAKAFTLDGKVLFKLGRRVCTRIPAAPARPGWRSGRPGRSIIPPK